MSKINPVRTSAQNHDSIVVNVSPSGFEKGTNIKSKEKRNKRLTLFYTTVLKEKSLKRHSSY